MDGLISPKTAAGLRGVGIEYIYSMIDAGGTDWGQKIGDGENTRIKYRINKKRFILAHEAIIDEELVREVVNV